MYDAQREAEEKRIQLARISAQADNQRDLMAATVGVLAERYRNRRKRFAIRFNLIAGLHNFELSLG